jgi:hypothetical protein
MTLRHESFPKNILPAFRGQSNKAAMGRGRADLALVAWTRQRLAEKVGRASKIQYI